MPMGVAPAIMCSPGATSKRNAEKRGMTQSTSPPALILVLMVTMMLSVSRPRPPVPVTEHVTQ
mgnify:CR=1 FL=1